MSPAITRPAAIAALVAAEDRENERVMLWELIPLRVRMVAMMGADLPRERASDPLTAFTAAERSRIASGMDTLSLHLMAGLRCMRDTAPTPTILLH